MGHCYCTVELYWCLISYHCICFNVNRKVKWLTTCGLLEKLTDHTDRS